MPSAKENRDGESNVIKTHFAVRLTPKPQVLSFVI